MSLITSKIARTGLFSVAVAALLGAGFTALPATAAPAAANTIHNNEHRVTGKLAGPITSSTGRGTSAGQHVAAMQLRSSVEQTVRVPRSTSTQKVTLPNGHPGVLTGKWEELKTGGIKLAPVASASSTATSVAAIKTTVLSSAEAKKHGLQGLVLELQRADMSAASAEVAVSVPAATLEGLYGADYAARTKWVEIPAGDSTSQASSPAATTSAQPVGQRTSANATTLTATISATPMLVAAVAAPISSTGTGNFTATPLKPSDSWNVSTQTGDFSWSYPLRTPPAAAGPSPQLALNYDSQAVDGESGSTNNQPDSVGEGWTLSGGGFIERSYTPCSDDHGAGGPVTTSGDLCWQSDNATISFGGHSGQLVKDAATGAWVLQSDDGSRIQHLVGASAGCGAANGTYDDDCWKVTTTDGTQYFFGMNELPGWASGKAATNSAWTVPVYGNDAGEPCHASTFAASSCVQAWRWNLDYVVDPDGNAEALYYDAQTNHYSQNGTAAVSYTRGGELDHIDYGITGNAPYATNAASDRVVFSYGANGRCVASSGCTAEGASGQIATPATPANYPDVPFDQNCASGACTGLKSPTFFSTSMLSTVTTQVFGGSSYANVDSWALAHTFPSPGDGTNAALWLAKVVHTGYSGSSTLAEPATVFAGAPMQNRVWALDGLAPLEKYRITSLQTNLGEILSVNYTTSSGCTPANAANIEANAATNTLLCYPEYWSPGVLPYTTPKLDLFFKYVVASTVDDPRTGGGYDQPIETNYDYTGSPAWRYSTSPLIPADQRTWNVYAGYNTVQVRVGDHNAPTLQQTTDYTFYQGMDGDRAGTSGGTKSVDVTGSATIPDSLWLTGQLREEKMLNGSGGATLSDTISTPWVSTVKANDGTNTARFVADGTDVTTEPVSTGGSRTTTVTNSYDDTYGLVTSSQKATSDAGTTCTTTGYTQPNTTAWIIGATQRVTELAVPCASAATAIYPADAISDTVDYYDGATVPATPATTAAAAPSKGHLTATQEVDSYSGTTAATAHWVTNSTTSYDALGRPTATTDVLGHTTTTAYTPSARGPVTSEKVTNALGWATTTAYNPAWGVETSVTDLNGQLTTATYDALGRRTAVWLPNESQFGGKTANASYAYTESQTGPSTITTQTLTASGLDVNAQLFDGLGRVVQTQSSGYGGAIMTDTGYDAAGRVNMVNNAYPTTQAAPSTKLFVPSSEEQISSETLTHYDGAGRTAATELDSNGTKRYETDYSYIGADRTDTTPPAGGTPTSSYTNSLGEQTSLTDWLAATPGGAAAHETTSYSYDPAGQMAHMVDAAGNAWSWTYDLLGHQTSATDPDTGTTTSSYDDAGDLLSSTDGRGQTVSYTYDADQRKTAEYQGTTTGSGGIELDSWTYDTLKKGQLTSSASYVGSTAGTPGIAYTDTIGSYSTFYTPLSNTIAIPTGAPALGGTSYTTVYGYNVDGTSAGQADPAEGGLPAETIRNAYDTEGQLASVTGSQLYSVIDRSGIGQPVGYDRDSGTTYLRTAISYDQGTGLILGIGDRTAGSTTPAQVSSRVYGRDNAGQVLSATNTTPSSTDAQCYSYDPLEELTAAWTPSSGNCATAPSSAALGGPAPYWESFTYDQATGNRLTATQHTTNAGGTDAVSTYSYPAAGAAQPHAVSQVSTTQAGATTTESFAYDQAGDATRLGSVTAAYNAQGQTASLTVGASTQDRVYDADGALLLESDPTAGTTVFLGDTELNVAPGSTAATGSRTYTAGSVVLAERDTVAGVSGSSLYWVGSDVDGTPDLEVNAATGAVTNRYTDPFGNPRGTAPTWSSDRGFLNDSASALTGLTQVGARLYNPQTGSFTTADPLLTADSFASRNAYAYAGNSPVTNTDPSGECLEVGDALSFRTNCAGGHGITALSGTVIAHAQQAAYEKATSAGQKYIRSFAAPKKHACDFACMYAGSQQARAETEEKQSVEFGKQLGVAGLFALGGAIDVSTAIESDGADDDAGDEFFDDAQKLEEDLTVDEDLSDPAATRVKLRNSTKLAIQGNAPKTASGDYIDPNTGEPVPKEGPFDYGHVPGYEWWRTQQIARGSGWSRRDVIEYENNPDHYQIENPSSNRSHIYELPR
ncbi:GH-E family nuclease [Gryllotalpicola koreensis]|uniref:RHS repeat-associated core domain-containing protein n=1 Tax=Gryllotalpicola koreensis TaxID=993086 RepID=A0ABP7ZZE8_9MICO